MPVHIAASAAATAVLVAAAAAALAPATSSADAGQPALEVEVVVDELDRPWDIAFTPDGSMLWTERDRERVTALRPDGSRSVLLDEPRGVWHQAEVGVMGIAVSPSFDDDHEFYVCHGWESGGRRDIRVTAWRTDADLGPAVLDRVLVRGITIKYGKHAGCRTRFTPDGALWISTGDSREGPLPQDKRSLNGKVLRVDPRTGDGWPDNPWADARNPDKRRVFSYGHRNAQGLAWRPLGAGAGQMWEVEQGTDRDDEVNRLVAGGNYGWNPMPDYNPTAPMTDHSLPGRQRDARWSSGFPTIATSGADWIKGEAWGAWEGRLAVGTTKANRVVIMEFTRRGELISTTVPPELLEVYGDLRVPVMGPDGAMYLTTDNGEEEEPGIDKILRVTPSGLNPP